MRRRLCPSCWADWIDIDDALCVMCQYDRDRIATRSKSKKVNHDKTDWWGPTALDFDADHKIIASDPNSMPWGYHLDDGPENVK